MTYIPISNLIPTGLPMEGAFGTDILQMVYHAGPVVKVVLMILLMFSVLSWAIIFTKYRLLRRAMAQDATFLDFFWETRDIKKIYAASEELSHSPVAGLFKAGYLEFSRFMKMQGGGTEGGSDASPHDMRGDSGLPSFSEESRRPGHALMENLQRALQKAAIDQTSRLEASLSFLATTGNTTPFIGLFGTVWGIMESFRGIGLKGSANLAVVAPGISEALVATAAGLAAAIPAVVAFNYYSQKVYKIRTEMDIFSSDFLSMVERQVLKRPVPPRRTT